MNNRIKVATISMSICDLRRYCTKLKRQLTRTWQGYWSITDWKRDTSSTYIQKNSLEADCKVCCLGDYGWVVFCDKKNVLMRQSKIGNNELCIEKLKEMKWNKTENGNEKLKKAVKRLITYNHLPVPREYFCAFRVSGHHGVIYGYSIQCFRFHHIFPFFRLHQPRYISLIHISSIFMIYYTMSILSPHDTICRLVNY